MRTQERLKQICEQFAIEGRFIDAQPHGQGYINDTYLGRYQTASGEEARFIHQRINHQVFKAPDKVMDNIRRVTQHARAEIIARGGDPERETLNLIPARDGAWFIHLDPESPTGGEYWRTYQFIDGAHSYEGATANGAYALDAVYHAAKAFGAFQKLLAGLPGGRLHETIPNFHHTVRRFDAFVEAVDADRANRAQGARTEIDFILRRQKDAAVIIDKLESGELPERGTHNDTKLNNVLMDNQTGKGICVVDLDTVMPGSALYDFGDLIRMGAATAAEDERDLSKVAVDLRLFEQLARGYLESAGDFLTPTEWDLLVFCGRLITYEQAIRFLGDYINGDSYYKTSRPGHNLDRACTQIKLLEEMEAKQDQMEAVVRRLAEDRRLRLG